MVAIGDNLVAAIGYHPVDGPISPNGAAPGDAAWPTILVKNLVASAQIAHAFPALRRGYRRIERERLRPARRPEHHEPPQPAVDHGLQPVDQQEVMARRRGLVADVLNEAEKGPPRHSTPQQRRPGLGGR